MRAIHYFSPWLKSLKKYQKVWWQIESALKSENELYDFVPNAADIWVRDFMPFQRHDEEFVIYRYNPDYLQGKNSKREFGIICTHKIFHSGHDNSGDHKQVSILEDVLDLVSTSVPEDELPV